VVCALALLALLAPAAQAAIQKLSKHTRECLLSSLGTGPEETPAEVATPIEAPVLASFGVLRRPAVAGDAIPALSPIGSAIDSEIASWYPAYARRVAVVGADHYYLIPVFLKEEKVPSASCLRPQARSQRPAFLEAARRRASELSYCLVPASGSDHPGGGCEPFADLETGLRLFIGGEFGSEAIVELAPDGVASVRVSYPTSPVETARVNENVYTFKGPASILAKVKRVINQEIKSDGPKHRLSKQQRKRLLARFEKRLSTLFDDSEPTKVEWLDPTGALVRLIGRPKTLSLQSLLSG
jgi:hypothetical protein